MVLLGLLAFAASSRANAFEVQRTAEGALVHWSEADPPRYRVQAEADQVVREAARFALDAWGQHLGPELRPTYAGLTRTSEPARDGESTLSLVDRWTRGDGDRLVAYTEVHYDQNSGLIYEADITLNGDNFVFQRDGAGAMDPDSVLLHEAGHWLGLAHSCGIPGSQNPSCFSLSPEARERVLGAVMAPSLGPGEVLRSLTDDDLDGLSLLYPEGFIRTASISLSSAERDCLKDRIVVSGRGLPPALEVRARFENGQVIAMHGGEHGETSLLVFGALSFSSTVTFDLLVSDPTSGEQASVLNVEALAPDCDERSGPREPPDGCECTATGVHGFGSGFTCAFLALAVLMVRRRRGLLALLVLIAMFGASSPAQAYRCSRVDFDEGPSLYWAERSIGFFIDQQLVANETQNLEFRQEITTSLATWTNEACSDFGFEVLGTKAVRAEYNNEGANENVITFIEATEGWAYNAAIIAVTTNTFETSTGRIIDSDIEVNRQHFEIVVAKETPACDPETGVMDLQNTMTHEVGHVIGLDHPPSTRTYAETTMFASAPSCETKKRSLSEDDIAGLCDIYPLGLPVAQCFPPNGPLFKVVEEDDGFGGCAAVREAGTRFGLAELALLVGLFGLYRRRQRPSTIPA